MRKTRNDKKPESEKLVPVLGKVKPALKEQVKEEAKMLKTTPSAFINKLLTEYFERVR